MLYSFKSPNIAVACICASAWVGALSACGGDSASSESQTTSTGAAAANASVTAAATTTTTSTISTGNVLCSLNYSGANPTYTDLLSTYSWSCNSGARMLTADGVPDHSVGTFPNVNNPSPLSAQTVSASLTLAPSATAVTGLFGSAIGYALNGVKFDPSTNGNCSDSGECTLNGNDGPWEMEVLGQTSFNFGVDSNNAHVQPGGAYHYHGMPTGILAKLGKGQAMTLVGWAADGFPVYARYGYTNPNDAASAIKVITGSYQIKSTADANRPSVSLYPMGTFTQDYEYVSGAGDLDQCNGRTGVTPEFPNGIYHYYITDTFPYIQRCVMGAPASLGI